MFVVREWLGRRCGRKGFLRLPCCWGAGSPRNSGKCKQITIPPSSTRLEVARGISGCFGTEHLIQDKVACFVLREDTGKVKPCDASLACSVLDHLSHCDLKKIQIWGNWKVHLRVGGPRSPVCTPDCGGVCSVPAASQLAPLRPLRQPVFW